MRWACTRDRHGATGSRDEVGTTKANNGLTSVRTGPLAETIAVLDRVVVEMDGFLDTIDWTG